MVDQAGVPVDPGTDVPLEAAAAMTTMGAPVDEDERDQQQSLVGAAAAAVTDGAGGQAALPGVLAEVPVAVLVIDQGEGTVVYANTAAIELAGNPHLPLPIDTWGASAGLTDLSGAALASTSNPLSRLALGRPVTGEAVRLSARRSSDELRASAADAADEQLLWVTGFPLSRADSDQRLALVVFLHLDEGHATADPETQLKTLRDRAVVATDIAFTITDPRRPDNPLVWVNPSFSRISGYSYAESIGQNCRFLQGPATDTERTAELRTALQQHEPITRTLLNYRKDGTAFWNQVSITPVFDGEGELISFVGVQTDVTERVRVEEDRTAALTAEKAARHEAEVAREAAERAQSRLALMAEATSTLSATLDLDDLLDRLAALCVPLLADWVFVTLVDEHGTVTGISAAHRRGLAEELRRFAALRIADLPEAAPIRRVLRSGEPVLVPEITEEILLRAAPDPALRAVMAELGTSSQLTVPLVARRRTLGALTLVAETQQRRFGPDDVDLARDLSRRAAMAMDNVRLYQQEHSVAEALQRSLLPELPEISRISAAGQYVSASSAAEVGGDFYDLLDLPDGSVGIAIGDVVGHDLAAAAAMGHLRGLLRACAWDAGETDAGRVLGRVDTLVQGLHVARMATMVYARAVPPAESGRPWQLTLANAGHPPLALRRPDGSVQLLDGVTGLLLGVDASAERRSHTVEVPAGSTLVAYTDGLIERPGADMDTGIALLVERLADAPLDAPPAELCVAAVGPHPDRRDDIAVIAVRFD
ncbi:SpoIIE family protein phosphatase [Modestobacter sp. SYSU DS0511]